MNAGEGRSLAEALDRARILLLAHGEVRWAGNFEQAARLLAEDEAKGVAAVLGFFGGMGSLTDRLPIDTGPDGAAFKALVDQAWTVARQRSKALMK